MKVKDLNEVEGEREQAGEWDEKRRQGSDGEREGEKDKRTVFGGKRRASTLKSLWRVCSLLHSTSGVNW